MHSFHGSYWPHHMVVWEKEEWILWFLPCYIIWVDSGSLCPCGGMCSCANWLFSPLPFIGSLWTCCKWSSAVQLLPTPLLLPISQQPGFKSYLFMTPTTQYPCMGDIGYWLVVLPPAKGKHWGHVFHFKEKASCIYCKCWCCFSKWCSVPLCNFYDYEEYLSLLKHAWEWKCFPFLWQEKAIIKQTNSI